MVLEFLFAAGVGAAITGAVSQKLDEAKSRQLENVMQRAGDCLKRGRPTETLSALEEAVKLNRLDPRIHMLAWHAYSQIAQKETDKTARLDAIDKAVQCYDVLQWLVGQGVFVPSEMLHEFEENTRKLMMIRDITTGKVQVQSKEGAEYSCRYYSAMEAGDAKKALVYINRAIEVETGHLIISGYHVKRAIVKKVLVDYAGAIRDCNVALRCEGLSDELRELAASIRDSAKAGQYAHKATLAMRAQNGDKALQHITKAIETGADEATIASYHVQRAILRQAAGDYCDALSDCDIALKCHGLDDRIRETARELRRSVKSRQQAEKRLSKPAAQSTRTGAKAPASKTRKSAA